MHAVTVMCMIKSLKFVSGMELLHNGGAPKCSRHLETLPLRRLSIQHYCQVHIQTSLIVNKVLQQRNKNMIQHFLLRAPKKSLI